MTHLRGEGVSVKKRKLDSFVDFVHPIDKTVKFHKTIAFHCSSGLGIIRC